ncbi:MAG: NAD-glutamate dehydrogenase [Deltaproteobacteria bacterium]|nr:NAD-glutamate dehydrogenase [Deltaproteobacteria bacterium]
MRRHLVGSELIERLLEEAGAAEHGGSELLRGFAAEVLKRVDERYFYRHRITTLPAQLLDSLRWLESVVGQAGPSVRIFDPQDDVHGYALEGTILETAMPDQPFIVDTLKLCLSELDVRLLNSLNVILPVVLDGEGGIARFDAGAEALHRTSYTRWYLELDGTAPEALADLVRDRLALAREVVCDFHRMVRAVKVVANEFEFLATLDSAHAADCEEVQSFLEWLPDDHFIFMGVSFYQRDPEGAVSIATERGLGSARGEARPSGPSTDAATSFFADSTAPRRPLLRVRKSTEEARMHRAGKVDEILVRLFDDRGQPSGGLIIHGLFTYKGLSEPGSQIPILSQKLARILDATDTVEGSYDRKALLNAFNTLPVEYLFEASRDRIAGLLEMNIGVNSQREVRSKVVINDDASSAYAFVALPKAHYSDDVRVAMQAALKTALRASYVDHRVHLDKYGTVALHFYLTGARRFRRADATAAEEALVRIGTPWQYRLLQQLEADNDPHPVPEGHARWAERFPEAYTDITTVEQAVTDIHHLEEVLRTGAMRFDIVAHPSAEGEAYIRIYSREPLKLTAILPVVDNFGVVVLEQASVTVPVVEAPELTVSTLRVERGEHDLVAQRIDLIGGLLAVFRRQMRSDRLNRLLLVARLSWREVDLLRAFANYSRQLAHKLAAETVQKVLSTHNVFVETLVRLFRMRFDPDLQLDADRRALSVSTLGDTLRRYLQHVKSFEEDRVLRIFLDLCQAVVRTSFYRRSENGEHSIALKFECARIAEMPEPRPMAEIYVHHAQVEGVHLRGGRVARGGIRWSDRLDDYRSEVLGLMATQMLKNTLIVPVGAKGGFVLKDPVEDPNEARARADQLYRVFIRGLLSVTDNREDGRIVPPERVVRDDGDDPYLVVAADKGTAHLSDTANAISAEFGFWLGDAFASGGSVGYDHKIMGITARGAWVSARRHFREMGVDPEVDPITAVGIGDMSGDVFGNGMLCSRTMKVVAAFNHRHIFLDPDPDPERSFAERQRLFDLGRSQWSDYDAALLSPGGGIFDRGDKSIVLSPEVRDLLDTVEESVSGDALIRLILRADVDLLWNGGIGTYVKASGETQQEVGDKDNDRVRVDASELRCRVFAEGGNLGITMRGRVEYAARGGRINLDAVDNSGGVDLSDHEVNLKILLQPPVLSGSLEPEARNELLRAVGDEVCERVLANNFGQSLGISLDVVRSQNDAFAFAHATEQLRDRFGFSRTREHLPSQMDVVATRQERRLGFYRPELAKLTSYSKMLAFAELSAHPLGSHEEARPWLVEYFPARVVAEHPAALDGHMLYDEIAATAQVNHIIHHAGLTFFPRMMAATDRGATDVAVAWLMAEDYLGARALRREILAQGQLTASAEYHGLIAIEDALARAARWFLGTRPERLSLGVHAQLRSWAPIVERIQTRTRKLLPGEAGGQLDDDTQRAVAAGLPTDLAQRIAVLRFTCHVPLIAVLERATRGTVEDAAGLWFEVGYAMRAIPMVDAVATHPYRDAWDAIAIASIERALFRALGELAAALPGPGGETAAPRALERTLARSPGLARVRDALDKAVRSRVPVSGMFVLGERLAHEVAALQRGQRADEV